MKPEINVIRRGAVSINEKFTQDSDPSSTTQHIPTFTHMQFGKGVSTQPTRGKCSQPPSHTRVQNGEGCEYTAHGGGNIHS